MGGQQFLGGGARQLGGGKSVRCHESRTIVSFAAKELGEFVDAVAAGGRRVGRQDSSAGQLLLQVRRC